MDRYEPHQILRFLYALEPLVYDPDYVSYIENRKLQMLVKNLKAARGVGNRLLSVFISPIDALSRVNGFLSTELEKVTHPLEKVALNTISEALVLYQMVPKPNNGLALFAGGVSEEDGVLKPYSVKGTPFRRVNESSFIWDDKYRPEALENDVPKEKVYGVVVVNRTKALIGNLSGNDLRVIHEFEGKLSGQFAPEFEHVRAKKMDDYISGTAKLMNELFLHNLTKKPTVDGIILAGSEHFPKYIHESGILNVMLRTIVKKVVGVEYGGSIGLEKAIEKAGDVLGDIRYLKDKRAVSRLLEVIQLERGYDFVGVTQSMRAIEKPNIKILIVWDEIDVCRYVLRRSTCLEENPIIKFLNTQQEGDPIHFIHPETKEALIVVEKMHLIEWLSNVYRSKTCMLKIVKNNSTEARQLCKAFEGIGGFTFDFGLYWSPVKKEEKDLTDGNWYSDSE